MALKQLDIHRQKSKSQPNSHNIYKINSKLMMELNMKYKTITLLGNKKLKRKTFGYSVQFCSVAQLCLTLCNPIDCSMPGLPVHHQLPEFTQTHIHWVGDAIQPSHPLSSPSPPAFNLSLFFPMSQFFTSGGQSIRVSPSASVLPMNIQDWFPLGWTGWISLQSKGLSSVFSNTTVQKHQFFHT